MGKPLPDPALDQIFRAARTRRGWTDEETPEVLIRATYELLRLAPTSSNISPGRFLFIRSKEAKARLEPHLDEGNRKQTMAAPYTAIIAYDLMFYENLPKTFPHKPDAIKGFQGEDKKAGNEKVAFRNGSLQGGYFIIAALARLDCGFAGSAAKASTRSSSRRPRDEVLALQLLCNTAMAMTPGHGLRAAASTSTKPAATLTWRP